MEGRLTRRLAAIGTAAIIVGGVTACEANGAATCEESAVLATFPQTELPLYLGDKGTEAQANVWVPIKKAATAERPKFPRGVVDIAYGYKTPKIGADDSAKFLAEQKAGRVETTAATQLGLDRLEDGSDIWAIPGGEPGVTIFIVNKC